jgi:hypothetical protein
MVAAVYSLLDSTPPFPDELPWNGGVARDKRDSRDM